MLSSEFVVRTVYGYGRASTEGQALSTAQQESVCRDQFSVNQRCRHNWANARWAGFFSDEATHVVTTRFFQRQQGSLLCAAAQPGDVIMVANYDRIFGNVIDCAETLDLLQPRNIALDILDMGVDLTTDNGQIFLKIMAVLKEAEVRNTRRRVKNMLAHRKQVGLPIGQHPVGWKTVKVEWHGRIHAFYVPNDEEREAARKLLATYERSGLPTRKFILNSSVRNPRTGRRFSGHDRLGGWLRAVRADFPLHNGEHEPTPIPADAKVIIVTELGDDP